MPEKKYFPNSQESSDFISRVLCDILAFCLRRHFNPKSTGIILCLQTQGQKLETDSTSWGSRLKARHLNSG